jgi:hypothetical protein
MSPPAAHVPERRLLSVSDEPNFRERRKVDFRVPRLLQTIRDVGYVVGTSG